jgi:hypothetical protein
MSGASIETTLELWASSLRDVKRRMRHLFTQTRVAQSAEHFLDGLLGEERRKTGWMRAEAAGDPGPWRPGNSWSRALERGCAATLCAIMRSRPWRTKMRFSLSTRRGF